MAARRGISIQPGLGGNANHDWPTIEIGVIDSDGEPSDEFIAAYRESENGWFFDCTCWGAEDWPYLIRDDRHLRSLLDLIAVEVKPYRV